MTALPCFLEADLRGKMVLVRMDHNVVKNGKIKDTMRIDATIPTLLHIYKKGGMPILMTHIGRPYDKKTGTINISEGESAAPLAYYLEAKLQLTGIITEYIPSDPAGLTTLSQFLPSDLSLRAGEYDLL